jgi:hypothetical protein
LFSLIDWGAGVGIAGHSMGGQSTAIASSLRCSERYGIRAAAIHHAASGDIGHDVNIGSNISVPSAFFTTTGDGIWNETKQIFLNSVNNTGGGGDTLSTFYRNQVGFSHLEPVLSPPIENPMLATFTAAWFNIFLTPNGAPPLTAGTWWYDAVFGTGDMPGGGGGDGGGGGGGRVPVNDTLCGYAKMEECVVHPPVTQS